MSYLPPVEICNLGSVSKYFSSLCVDEEIWRDLCVQQITQDDSPQIPKGMSTWREYCPRVRLFNELRRTGHLFLNHLLMVAGPQWESISVALVQHGGAMTLDWKVTQIPVTADSTPEISVAEYSRAVAGLGITNKTSINHLSELYEEMSDAITRYSNEEWDGSAMVFRHVGGFGLSAEVILSLYDSSSMMDIESDGNMTPSFGNPLFEVRLNPRFCLINPHVLKEIAEIHRGLRDHNDQLRRLLTSKRNACVDFGSSQLKLTDGDDDPSAINLPIQVLGTYSDEFKNWRWSWGNSQLNRSQYELILNLKDQSLVRDDPESNLFATPSIDCELPFAFALAHLAVSKLSPSGMSVFPYYNKKTTTPVRTFLAIQN